MKNDATASAGAPSEVFRSAHHDDKDFTSRDGADALKEMIEAYWRKRGYEVDVILVPAAFTPALRAARYDVRSQMINGMPRNKAARAID